MRGSVPEFVFGKASDLQVREMSVTEPMTESIFSNILGFY